jgi:hypothetical protein
MFGMANEHRRELFIATNASLVIFTLKTVLTLLSDRLGNMGSKTDAGVISQRTFYLVGVFLSPGILSPRIS